MEECITEDTVVLIQRGKTYRPFKLKKGKKLHFEKISFYPDGALGHKYGSCFKVEKQKIHLVGGAEKQVDYSSVKGEECGSDNRKLHDDGTSQVLTEHDIRSLKGEGMSGQGIVATMIEHSATFKDKTKFSQEKYIRRKEMKYTPLLRIIRPTTKLLCDLYFIQSPNKTYYLRKDSLSRILSLSNVHAHSNMVVMEMCQGFLVGAILERMGGYGNLLQVFFGDYPVRTVLENFSHLSERDLSILHKYPLHKVGSLLKGEESRSVAASLRHLLDGQARSEPAKKGGPKFKKQKVLPTTVQDVDSDENGGGSKSGEPSCKRIKVESSSDQSTAVCDDQLSEGVEQKDTSLEDGERKSEMEMGVSSCASRTMEERGSLAVASGSGTVSGSGTGCRSDIRSRTIMGDGSDIDSGSGTRSVSGGGVCAMETDDGAGKSLEEVVVNSEATTGGHDKGEEQASGLEDMQKQQEETKLGKEEQTAKKKKRQEKEEAYRVAGELLSQRNMDGLVVVCRHHPEPVVMALVNFLAPSRPVVVYSHVLEPLVQCYKTLKESGLVFQMQISETWMRNYQVLEGRTHPEMLMDGQSGYILTAVVVQKNSAVQ